MPTFEIPDGPTSVDVEAVNSSDPKAIREGSAVFNVKNKSGAPCGGRLSVQTAGTSKAEWFSVEGDRERNFGPGESQTATIRISVPADVAAGDYPFRLRVVAVNDPDNDHADGPVATAKLKSGVPKPPPNLLWLWILLGILALAAVAGGVWYFLSNGKDDEIDPVFNKVAESTEGDVPNFIDSSLDAARAAAAGYELVEVPGPASGKAPNTVVAQAPQAGSRLTRGGIVRVTFDPGVTVPPLNEMDVGAAVRTLQAVPLHINASTSKCETAGTPDRIVDQNPKAGAKVAANSGIDVTVRIIGQHFGRMAIRCGRPFRFDEGIRVQPGLAAERARARIPLPNQ